MVERTVLVDARLGLHARAAAKLVRVASKYQSNLLLRRADSSASADAKSILSVLMLAATHGTTLQVSAEGIDEEAAVNAVVELFMNGFGETTLDSTK